MGHRLDPAAYPRLTLDDLCQTTTLSLIEYCGVSGKGLTTARAQVKSGAVPAIRAGRNIRIPTPFVLRELGIELASATSGDAGMPIPPQPVSAAKRDHAESGSKAKRGQVVTGRSPARDGAG